MFTPVVRADTGPKPSVRITFENLGDDLCYGTLLADDESTGPSSAWDGSDEDARHNENPNGYYSYQPFGYDVWKAFVDYAEKDDYFFLQEAWRIDESKELAWTYYPPDTFKILLYFPETGEYAISGVYERYAFDSYYTVNMNGVVLSVDYNEELSSNDRINAYRSYNYRVELMSLAARIVITILLELLIALLFGYRGRKQLLLLAVVNVVTQVLLNLLLNVANYRSGQLAALLLYVLFEIVVVVIESVVFCYLLDKTTVHKKSKRRIELYALTANTVSFGTGLLLARWLPGIF